MTATEETKNRIAEITALSVVKSVRNWKDKRAYITLNAYDASFAGCRNHQFYVDLEKNVLVDEMGKGMTPREYDAQRATVLWTWIGDSE